MWGWSGSTVDRTFALYSIDSGLIPGVPYDVLSQSGVISEYRANTLKCNPKTKAKYVKKKKKERSVHFPGALTQSHECKFY